MSAPYDLSAWGVTLRVAETGPGEAVTSSEDAARVARALIPEDGREHVVALYLNQRGRLMGHWEVSVGSVSCSVIHPREVYRPAVILGASAVILAHNHPSGDPEPSVDDRRVTSRVAEAGRVLGIPLQDHVVVGHGGAWESLGDLCEAAAC